ncbi:MAG: Xaa-Pro peptidase family protein [Chloroflexota bacterium]|nr:Xaa-Pro peptidase family protein [Chloroflexota bacterium]
MPTFNERLQRFQQLLHGNADVAFIPISADLHYLTGVPRDIPNFGVTLHPGAWAEGAWLSPSHAPVLVLPRMSAEFGGLSSVTGIQLRVMGDWDNPTTVVQDILRGFGVGSTLRIAIGERALAETVAALHEFIPATTFSNATHLLRQLRAVKDADEITIMRKAGAITEAAFADVLKQLKHGMTELDIVSEVDYQLRRHGSLGPSFTTSLYNSGPHTPLLFGQREATWKRVLTPPVSILFDFGAVYDGFCYDYGRTVSFGQPSEEQQRVYDLVMASQRAGIAAMKAGQVTTTQVDAAARQVIADAGYGEAFRHRLGHGIGMDVHEPPFLTKGDETLIQEGMMFTVEPSITQFDNFSARVEDVIVARPNGGEALTTGYQSLIVID